MTRNRITCYLCGVLGLGLLIGTVTRFGSFLGHSSTDASSVSETVPNTTHSTTSGIVCLGYIDGEKGTTALSPAHPGCIAEILVHEGEEVRSGTALLRLDAHSSRFAVEQARAAQQAASVRLAQAQEVLRQHPFRLAQQKASLDAARSRLAVARQVQARKEELLPLQLINVRETIAAAERVNELEALGRAEQERFAELQRRDAELPLRLAQAERSVSRARLREAEYVWQQCTLKAPEAGTVLRILVGRGSMVSGGTGQAALLFRPAGPPIVRVDVEQEFVGQLTVGQTAMVEDEFHAGGPWRGRLLRIADWHAPQRSLLQQPPRFIDVPTVECIVSFDPKYPQLRLGQRVRVTIPAVTDAK